MSVALVTGHRGLIGSHFRRLLLDEGWKVVGRDVADGPQHDCRHYFASSNKRFDLVVHCAAIVGGRAKIDGAPMAVAENLSIDAAMFQWALRTRPGHVLYWSSSAAYPVGLQDGYDTAQLTEDAIDLDDIAHPDQTYGLAKLVGEVQARLVHDAGVAVTVPRTFSGYGADQSLDYPFPSFVDRAARRADPFDIWGNGLQVRDWIHVDDVVRGAMAAVTHGHGGPVNLCTGRATSFVELADLVTQAAGYQPEIRTHPDKPTGVAYRVGDPTRMESFYRPAVTLEDGIDRALAAHPHRA